MSETKSKSVSIRIDQYERLEKIAKDHGVKIPVILDALLSVTEVSDGAVDPFIERAKTESSAARSKVASERAKTTHARRKALQAQNDGVE